MKLWLALIAFASLCAGCVSPITEARKFLETPAGQKLIDTMEMEASADNPAIEIYMINGFGIRGLGVRAEGVVRGEVSPDERGTATTQPVDVP